MMLDVSKAIRERNTLALTYGVTQLKPATLAGVAGVGTIQVVRTVDGDILELIGTWRLVNDEDCSVELLKRACEQQQSITYEGYVSDPLYPDAEAVKVDVQILSIRPYLHHPEAEAGEKGITKTFYRLKLDGSLPQPYSTTDALSE
jgi:hypothetical protein